MNQLSANWLTEGLIDFEYKKYILLGYLQKVSQSFDERKLYPFLADLIFHHQNLWVIRKNKQVVSDQFPRKIKKIDVDNFKLIYEKMMHDHSYIEEVEQILNYAIPKIEQHLRDGKAIYQFVEDKLAVHPVGIVPLQADEGYLLLSNGKTSDTAVYGYHITIFENAVEKYRAIKTSYLESYSRRFSNTFQYIKLDLIKRRKELPNPATFVVTSEVTLPIKETLLPIAKRSLVRFISQYSA